MNTKFLISTMLSIPLFIEAVSSAELKPSEQLRGALDGLDISKVQCYCVCEFDGKSQLAAGIEMSKILEEELAENEGVATAKLSDYTAKLSDYYIDGFIGISSGALIASHLALGGHAADIEESLRSLTSKMIAPKSLSGCLACVGKTTQLASYFIDSSNDDFDDSEKMENNYDGIVMNSDAISAISHITSGTDYDLKSGLTILSTSENPDFSEQAIAAIKEADNATKKNMTKFAFDTILDAAKTVTSITMGAAGSRINQTAAQKALDIMTKVGKGAERIDSTLNNTLFKQNLTRNLATPTAECPVLVIDLKAKTGDGNAIKTTMSQEFRDNFVKVTYLTEIPLSLYPSKKLPFETIERHIDLSIKDCMQSIRLDSAKATDILTDFLTAVKLKKCETEKTAE